MADTENVAQATEQSADVVQAYDKAMAVWHSNRPYAEKQAAVLEARSVMAQAGAKLKRLVDDTTDETERAIIQAMMDKARGLYTEVVHLVGFERGVWR